MNKTLEARIRDICTYHSDEGTSGWLLSDDQFNAILQACSEAVDEIINTPLIDTNGWQVQGELDKELRKQQRQRKEKLLGEIKGS